MKAIRYHRHGGPEVLQLDEVPEPAIQEGQALLEVKAIGVNHLDIWLRKGLPGIKVGLPRIPGADAAGVVREIRGACDLRPGDRALLNPGLTCGRCEFCAGGTGSLCLSYAIFGEHTDGSYAEVIAVPARNLLKMPDRIPFDEGAAAPLAFLTAWRMLMVRARLRASDDVLIVSAGAGVGTVCVQLAKLAGCRVFATAGGEAKCARLRELGADHVIDHSAADFSREVRRLTDKRGVDVVVDYTGKETWSKSILSLRRGGRLVTCGATSGHDPVEDLRHIFYRQLEILGSTMGSDKDFRDAMKLFFEGKLRPAIDRTLPLSAAEEAHRAIEARQVFGKVVLTT
jgi:NADPH:quinone reductase-like Zn-dependent oxidoreductase